MVEDKKHRGLHLENISSIPKDGKDFLVRFTNRVILRFKDKRAERGEGVIVYFVENVRIRDDQIFNCVMSFNFAPKRMRINNQLNQLKLLAYLSHILWTKKYFF